MRPIFFSAWTSRKRLSSIVSTLLLTAVLFVSSIIGFNAIPKLAAAARSRPASHTSHTISKHTAMSLQDRNLPIVANGLISLNRRTFTSSVQSPDFPAQAAVDNNPNTRWSSAWSNQQWIAIDFGSPATIDHVTLSWNNAYARTFQIQVSDEQEHWSTVFSQNNGKGGTQSIHIASHGRYIRMDGIQAATEYGFSLWNFAVYGHIGYKAMPTQKKTSPSAKPTPQTVPTPQPTPATVSTGNPGSASSGQAMPVGDLPGWHQIFAENFNTPASLGAFPGNAYGNEFSVYPDGARDTAGQQGAPSRYYPSKVVSVSNGMLNLYLHSENGTPMAAAILPNLPGNHLYGKYTVRFRADSLAGFKTAWLLWPDNNNWPHDGEIDFPENDLNGTINAFMHREGASSGSDQDAFSTNATDSSWHTASIEWTPSAVRFILDGQVIGTSTSRIPDTPMHWVLQTESCLDGCPAPSTAGNVQIDWVVAYSFN